MLIRGGKVISIGINKYKAGCLIDQCYGLKGFHAECNALYRFKPEDTKGSILYVAGWSKGGNVVCSKPCKHCQEYLKRFDLKAIIYSTPDGYAAM